MKEKRIEALREAVKGLGMAERKHDGYKQCYYVGIVKRMKHLLVNEHGMTRAEVDEIEESAK